MEPELRTLELSRPGTWMETLRQPRLASRDTQRTAVNSYTHSDGSSELGEIIFLQAVIGMKPEKTTTQLAAFQEIAILLMGWQQEEVVN